MIKLIESKKLPKKLLKILDFVVSSQLQLVLLYSDAPISYAVPFLVELQTLCHRYDTLNRNFRRFPATFRYQLHYSNCYRTCNYIPLHRLNQLLKLIQLSFLLMNNHFKFCCVQLSREKLSVFGSVHRKCQKVQQRWKGCQTRGWQLPFISRICLDQK